MGQAVEQRHLSWCIDWMELEQVEPARRRYRMIRVLVLSDDLIRSARLAAPACQHGSLSRAGGGCSQLVH